MHRGVETELYLRPGLAEDNFVAMALGNLAGRELAAARHERLVWQILRVELSHQHHYRLLIAHPDRRLDLGIKADLKGILDRLSALTVEALHGELDRARAAGLDPVPLRTVHEVVDFWQDDFWTALGGPAPLGPEFP
ncbi:MAG: DUF2004 domain-containing protein [Thermoplasmata archaeon]